MKINKFNFIIIVIFTIIIACAIYFIVQSSLKRKNVVYPFFVSTKTALTNVRTGAGVDYPILISYKAYSVPLKVLEKYNEWYKVQNFNGSIGWVAISLVVKKSSAIILKQSNLYITADLQSKLIGIIKKDNIVLIDSCKQDFCKIIFKNSNKDQQKQVIGWVLKQNLWGDVGN
jgi:SH3-like domain-containing protein